MYHDLFMKTVECSSCKTCGSGSEVNKIRSSFAYFLMHVVLVQWNSKTIKYITTLWNSLAFDKKKKAKKIPTKNPNQSKANKQKKPWKKKQKPKPKTQKVLLVLEKKMCDWTL